jgi:polyphosphate kinase
MAFVNGGEPEWWLGSSDLMHRNLDRRVEVLLKVCDEPARQELETFFQAEMAPDVRCWELHPDGTWTPRGKRDLHADWMRQAGEQAG